MEQPANIANRDATMMLTATGIAQKVFRHDGGFADDRPWLLRVFDFFSACAFSILDCALRQRSGHSLFELLQIHGLGDKIKSSFMNRLDGGFYRAKSGHHDDGKRGMFLM